jgi:hypothetical protein
VLSLFIFTLAFIGVFYPHNRCSWLWGTQLFAQGPGYFVFAVLCDAMFCVFSLFIFALALIGVFHP